VDAQPLRNLGTYQIGVRLTVDLIPTVTVIVHREGEAPELPEAEAKPERAVTAETGASETEGE
jgi:large subunit ribosomal protein L9